MLRAAIIMLVMLLWQSITLSQTIYNMSNATVTDCKGTLLDSEAGPNGSTYGHNENYVFTICTGAKITMIFQSPFKIESYDTLYLYDGADTNSTLLGAYTDSTLPPTTIANSGCLTAHFKSDNNVAYLGWEADWTSDVIAPIPPTMSTNPAPSCSTNIITVTFSGNVFCDSVKASDFAITGPVNNIFVNTITSSLNCNSAGDSTNTFTLYLNKNLDKNCWYNIDFSLGIRDNCDSLWYFNLLDSFLLDDCSFTVDIQASPDTICAGLCTDLIATVSGNGPNCLTYNYTWNNGLPNSPGPHNVCPTGTLNYTVLVQSTTGGPSVAGQKTIVFVNPQINEQDTITLCQSDSAFNINVNSSGGRFWGNGIVDNITGLFVPDSAGPGSHYIKYGFTNFCEDSILIIVKALDAGLPEAACPGATPFMLSGFSPSGGIWAGDSVTASGMFNPALPGTYVLTYSYNGCSEKKVVSVDSISLILPVDTVCQSDTAFIISVNPPGGRWTGQGITDSVLGWFNPSVAGSGTKNLVYKLSGVGNSGCSFNISITVNPIEAYWGLVACPTQPPFILSPAGSPSGGVWTGLGITNGSTGLYDPAQAFSGSWTNDTLTYTAQNGCSDTRVVYIRYTRVYDDSVFFCANDTSLYLDWWGVRRTPGGGIWTGNGLTNIGRRYYFNPIIAGVGVHQLMYTANTCVDSIIMVVFPDNIKFSPFNYLWPDTTVCSTHPAWNFPSMPPGGKWIGQGITDKYLGTYTPSVAGTGSHTVKYITPNGCVDDSVIVTVYPYVPAQILNLDTSYCYKDTLIPITLKPKNGVLTGNGVVNGIYFNPAVAGEGVHTLTYSFGNGFCETSTSINIRITTEISIELLASDTLLCPGESTNLRVKTNGGASNSKYTYQWNNNLFPVPGHTVSPSVSTWYVVQAKDGCSDPGIDSVYIFVADKVIASVVTSEKLCFGADGFAKVVMDSIENYKITWKASPDQIIDSIEGIAGKSYPLTVEDERTGCAFDSLVKIPSFKNIVANFSTSPNFECIPSNQKVVTFLDLSQNADSGSWDIAGLTVIPYVLGKNPQYTFTKAGFYTISLIVFNEGLCSDEFIKELCVEDIRPIFVADAFTPNGDGVNDVLHVRAKGVKEINFKIFDRWGNLVFESNSLDDGWDGTYRGKKANAGVYVYIVQSKLINNEFETVKGDVTLVR